MPNLPLLYRLGSLLCLLLASSAVGANTSSAHQLLKKMSEAGSSVNYRGSFAYVNSSSLESFRVLHWVDDEGVEFERIEHLSGPEREVVRRIPSDTCARFGDTLLQGRVTRLASGLAEIDDFYQVILQGEERVAGRQVHIVQIIPKDNMRYGYVLGLDKETGVLLQSLLLDEQQRLMERFQFIDFEVNPDLTQLSSDGISSSEERSDSSSVDCSAERAEGPTDWVLHWVPSGFEFSGEKQLGEDTRMLMYTDGLATFSVFLQPTGDQLRVEARAQWGATTAYMGTVSNGAREYRLSVVGEIPSGVAERLAQDIRPLSVSAERGDASAPLLQEAP